jgi:hypothetical protein
MHEEETVKAADAAGYYTSRSEELLRDFRHKVGCTFPSTVLRACFLGATHLALPA